MSGLNIIIEILDRAWNWTVGGGPHGPTLDLKCWWVLYTGKLFVSAALQFCLRVWFDGCGASNNQKLAEIKKFCPSYWLKKTTNIIVKKLTV